jgi:hypothetical protein
LLGHTKALMPIRNESRNKLRDDLCWNKSLWLLIIGAKGFNNV